MKIFFKEIIHCYVYSKNMNKRISRFLDRIKSILLFYRVKYLFYLNINTLYYMISSVIYF